MLRDLIEKEQVAEEDIVVKRSEVPEIWYEDNSGKRHRYFVDCYIPSKRRCVEVKSTWTAEKNMHNIFLKQKAVQDAGYQSDLWIYNANGERVECHL
jgi:hypothetical protein